MSRSYWHTPIKSYAGNRGCKEWRTAENRRYRVYVRNCMVHERYDDIQEYAGRFGNEWDSPRDGKGWCGEIKYRQCPHSNYIWGTGLWCEQGHHRCYKYYEELMRK